MSSSELLDSTGHKSSSSVQHDLNAASTIMDEIGNLPPMGDSSDDSDTPLAFIKKKTLRQGWLPIIPIIFGLH